MVTLIPFPPFALAHSRASAVQGVLCILSRGSRTQESESKLAGRPIQLLGRGLMVLGRGRGVKSGRAQYHARPSSTMQHHTKGGEKWKSGWWQIMVSCLSEEAADLMMSPIQPSEGQRWSNIQTEKFRGCIFSN